MPVFDAAHRARLNEFDWYTPRFLLGIFVVAEFIIFFDRGNTGGALQQIRQDPTISGSNSTVLPQEEAGLLNSVFIVGFLLASAISVGVAGYIHTRTLLCGGAILFACAILLCAAAPDYPSLVVGRCLSGLGESCFVPIIVTLLDNIAPPERRSFWISIFWAQAAVGMAAGVGIGGTMAQHASIGSTPGWRITYGLEFVASLVLAVFFFFIPVEYDLYDDEARVQGAPSDIVAEQVDQRKDLVRHNIHGDFHIPLLSAFWMLIKRGNFLLLCLGYAAFLAFIGGTLYVVQMLTYGTLNLSETKAGLVTGGILIVAGLAGSLTLGKLADYFAPRGKPGTGIKCTIIIICAAAIGIPAAAAAMVAQHLWQFVCAFLVGGFALVGLSTTIQSAILSSVPSYLRAYAISCSLVIAHGLGDFLSPLYVAAVAKDYQGACRHVPERICELLDFSNETYGSADSDWFDGSCRWISDVKAGDVPFCTNTMALPKAMLCVLAVASACIPLWLVVVIRRKCCATAEEIEMEEDELFHDEQSTEVPTGDTGRPNDSADHHNDSDVFPSGENLARQASSSTPLGSGANHGVQSFERTPLLGSGRGGGAGTGGLGGGRRK